MLPEFDLMMPSTLTEALEILTQLGSDVTPVAGGTNVIVDLRGRDKRYKALMSVMALEELQGICQETDEIVVGGATTISAIVKDPVISRHGVSLREAAGQLGNTLIRNLATVAGNLVDASPAADTAPPLLVLDAVVEMASKDGKRRVPLTAFFKGLSQTDRRPEELVVAVCWPKPPARSASAFRKVGLRKAAACSVASAAAYVEIDDAGMFENARIALGSLAPRPIRAIDAEEALKGERPSETSLEEAAHLAAEATSPISDVRGSADYRKRVAEVLVRRVLEQAVIKAGS
jgi:CO/xanthine dehydrogenase FAD-binding subunit